MRTWSMALCVAAAAAMVGMAGCSKKQSEQSASGEAALGQLTGTASGVRWTIPKRWTDQGQRPMRVATYAIPASAGDSDAGECAVFYFGNDQGGSVDANIDRWVGQFENPGMPAKATKDVNGMTVTLVQVAGTYLAPGGPMMQSQGKKDNFRLLGAIVQAPQGSVFFKLTGPSKTVADAESEFNAMIGSLAKQG